MGARFRRFLRERFLEGNGEPVNPIHLAFRALLLLVLFVWGWKFIVATIASNTAGTSVLHHINLPLHEAGHVVFGWFGTLIGALGGTLMQLLFPLLFVVAFLWQRQPFGAAACLWWLGESLMESATYINDARDLRLVLLGGVTGKDVADYHDWQFILTRLDMLTWDHALARLAQGTGIALLLGSAAWGGVVLWLQYRRRETT
ncbi:MAG: zinc ribbon domain-containing protein [Deltaproteobacteria bacterium]|nr:zinc ribbon domain-containing protein [Deltaproteobacteria bacterium]